MCDGVLKLCDRIAKSRNSLETVVHVEIHISHVYHLELWKDCDDSRRNILSFCIVIQSSSPSKPKVIDFYEFWDTLKCKWQGEQAQIFK